jgi:hypothetical protein
MRSAIAALCSALLVALGASSAYAAKPAPPPPTPTCAPGAATLIPSIAFAYSFKLYTGNAAGTCAVQLATLAQQYPMAFTFDGAKYRVFWLADNRDVVKLISRMRWTIKMVEFTVGPLGGIVESLPLQVHEPFRDSVNTTESTLGSIGATKDGKQIIFTRKFGGTTEIWRIDLASGCRDACVPVEPIAVPGVSSVVAQFGSGIAGDKRIYLKEDLASGEQVLAFMERDASGSWLGPRVVASTFEYPYIGARFGGMRIGALVDFDEFIAIPWTPPPFSSLLVDVLKTMPTCTVLGGPLSCLSQAQASVFASELPAYQWYYGIDWKPDGSLLRVNDSHVIESFGPSSATTIIDHGPGIYPTGLKQ